MPPQKSIATFFARAPAKEGAGTAGSKEKENGPSTAPRTKPGTAANKPLNKAQPKAASPVQDEAADVVTAGAADGKKRKRRQVIEDSPSKSDAPKEKELEDHEIAPSAPTAPSVAQLDGAAVEPSNGTALAASSAAPMDITPDASAAGTAKGAEEPLESAAAAAAAAAAAPAAAAAGAATAAATAAAPAASPKKMAAIFMKPQPKPKAAPAPGIGAIGASAAGAAAGPAKAAADREEGAGKEQGKVAQAAGLVSGGVKGKAAVAAVEGKGKGKETGKEKGKWKDKGSAKAAKDDAEESGSADEESGDELEDELEDEIDGDEEEAAAGPASGKTGKAPAAKKRKVEGSSKVDGVGLGAIAAAARHGAVDTTALVGDRWQAGKPVPFEFLADTFESIAETSGRLDIIHLLVNCFRAILTTTPEDLLAAVYLCTNRVAPAHTGVELGVGESTLIKALAKSTGRSEAHIKDALREEGDLGTIAVKMKSTQRTLVPPARLTIRGVYKALKDIAATSGKDSQGSKLTIIQRLLGASKGNETGYIMRALQAKLRIGLAEQSVLVALAHSAVLHRTGSSNADGKLADRLEQAAQTVKQAYCECPCYDVLVPALLAHPVSELPQHCRFMAGVPIKPMLAKATNAVGEVLDKFQGLEFTCEYKYDGERAQLHVLEDAKKSVMIFSRNSENNTSKYPDIVKRVHSSLMPDVKSIVIDSEAVAWDKDKKKILPFQVLSTRKRKDVEVASIGVQVCVFAFDCLYLNGRSLLGEPLEERRRALYSSLKEVPGEMQFATAKTSKDIDELQRFLDESVEACTEGLIVKTLHDTYEPSRRSSHWLKLKKDYLQGVGDTFDVVPIGAWHGKGKRTGVYGAYLLSIYDPDTETYQTISKLGTGFSEEELSALHERCAPHIIPTPKKYYQWHENLAPDVWFDAALVWEVKAADLSISPVHKAASGLVDPNKGISIRFPRLVRVREDKAPEDATTAQQVVDMFKKQAYHQPDAVAEDEDDA